MKKVYLASAMMGAAMILAAPAQAVDSTVAVSVPWPGAVSAVSVRKFWPQRPTVLSVRRLSALLSVRPAVILTAA